MGFINRLFKKKITVKQQATPRQKKPVYSVSQNTDISKDEILDSPELWANKLKDRKNYRILAAIYNSKDLVDSYQEKSEIARKKRDLANEILKQAGTEAVEAIIEELANDGFGSIDLAELLVEIADPKAVPILKKNLDRGEFDAYASSIGWIRNFVEKYPELHGEIEKIECALCGKTRPVTEMKGAGTTFFCIDTCYKKRGQVLYKGTGADCPFHVDGMCTAGDGGMVCSLKSGSYKNSCYVFDLHRWNIVEKLKR